MSSFAFYDLETFHLHPSFGRIAQFASVYADEDLHEIGEPCVLYQKQSLDILPSPIACAVTGITPETTNHGLLERPFAEKILKALGKSDIHGGFNTNRFDSLMLRFLFYRNFLEPYQLEQGARRFDVIDILRTLYALRPKGLNVPVINGVPTLALEHVAEANGLMKEKAHDALSDARTTLALASFIKSLQPKLWDFLIQNRSEQSILKLAGDFTKPMLHVSSQYPMSEGHLAPVALFSSPRHKRLLAYNLRVDPDEFSGLSLEALQERLFTPHQKLKELGKTPLPVKEIHLKKNPVLLPFKLYQHPQSEGQWNLDCSQIESNAKKLSKGILGTYFKIIYAQPFDGIIPKDSTQTLYSHFFQQKENLFKLFFEGGGKEAHWQKGESFIQNTYQEEETRSFLSDFWLQYCFKNAPDSLSSEGKERMNTLVQNRLLGDPHYPSLSQENFLTETKDSRVKEKPEILASLYSYLDEVRTQN